jgi:hypothetical protein
LSEQPPDASDVKLGRFASAADAMIYLLTRRGYAHATGGSEESITGTFAKLSVPEPLLPVITHEFEAEIDGTGLTDPHQLIGHFLVVEDGFVLVKRYPDRQERDYEFGLLEVVHRSWLAQRMRGQA